MKSVVITGSTRGLGFEMAKVFLEMGCKVTISGTSDESVNKALKLLAGFNSSLIGIPCNVTDPGAIRHLFEESSKKWGRVDIWINNAGINQPDKPIWDIEAWKVENIVKTNILGVMFGSQVAMRGMLKQGSGQIYNMEGWGSDGKRMNNINIYGTSKNALRYFTKGLIDEAKDSNVQVGTLSPGMMVTDFLMDPLKDDPEKEARLKRIFNILADKADRVARFLVPKIVANTKHGVHFAWLTTPKIIWRFLTAGFRKRDLFDN